MIQSVLFLIRHKSTGEIMPLYRRGRGYSHWNPGNPNAEFIAAKDIGWRFLKDEKQAKRVIHLWATQPNLHMKYDYGGEPNLDIKDDGRKIEDLEVVAISLQEISLS